MERRTIQVGTFAANCTVLSAGGRAWVIDPGAEPERIAAMLSEMRLDPVAILLTHSHFDHICGVCALQKAYPGLPVYVHPADEPAFAHPLNQYPPAYVQTARPDFIHDVRTLPDSDVPFSVRVIETPGHTPGGVCYHLPDDALLISGDTLFAGSIGRTDLPGGDMAALMASLKKLAALPRETVVVPGHGPETTIGEECRSNPFLA